MYKVISQQNLFVGGSTAIDQMIVPMFVNRPVNPKYLLSLRSSIAVLKNYSFDYLDDLLRTKRLTQKVVDCKKKELLDYFELIVTETLYLKKEL